ncbi:hypothetical protein FQZ97_1115110 [compost metagenome]
MRPRQIQRLKARTGLDDPIATRFKQIVEELHVELVVFHDHDSLGHWSSLACLWHRRFPDPSTTALRFPVPLGYHSIRYKTSNEAKTCRSQNRHRWISPRLPRPASAISPKIPMNCWLSCSIPGSIRNLFVPQSARRVCKPGSSTTLPQMNRFCSHSARMPA